MYETNQGTIKPITYLGIIKDKKLLIIDYKTPPNPERKGWWIPAPGVEFGEDPQDRAKKILSDLGLSSNGLKLKDVESFVTPGGWHILFHYTVTTNEDIKPNENILAHKWVSLEDLPGAEAFAHGRWELGLAKFFLE